MWFLATVLDLVLVLVFWTKMLFSFSQILVTSICDSFSPVLVDSLQGHYRLAWDLSFRVVRATCDPTGHHVGC